MMVETLLNPGTISLDDSSHSKKRVLERAAQLLGQHDQAMAELIFERLLERERLGSTGMAGGVALPHARMPGMRQSRGAFIRLTEAIDFDSLDEQSVDLIFILLVPEQGTEEHLQLLADLARLLRVPSTRQAMREAKDATEIQRLLAEPTVHVA